MMTIPETHPLYITDQQTASDSTFWQDFLNQISTQLQASLTNPSLRSTLWGEIQAASFLAEEAGGRFGFDFENSFGSPSLYQAFSAYFANPNSGSLQAVQRALTTISGDAIPPNPGKESFKALAEGTLEFLIMNLASQTKDNNQILGMIQLIQSFCQAMGPSLSPPLLIYINQIEQDYQNYINAPADPSYLFDAEQQALDMINFLESNS